MTDDKVLARDLTEALVSLTVANEAHDLIEDALSLLAWLAVSSLAVIHVAFCHKRVKTTALAAAYSAKHYTCCRQFRKVWIKLCHTFIRYPKLARHRSDFKT